MNCQTGYQGHSCHICDPGYHKYQDRCYEGECSPLGTQERDSDGTCQCKPAYAPGQCHHCDPKYHMNTDTGTCQPGSCHPKNTQERSENGTCMCQDRFSGMTCRACDEDEGYTGPPTCSRCHPNFYKLNDVECILGQCDATGTQERDEDGFCLCKLGYGGAACDVCATGYMGKLCDQCQRRFTRICTDGTCLCKGHKFLLVTGERGSQGEILDVADQSWKCLLQGDKEFPDEVTRAEGALVHGTPLICGGMEETESTDHCWKWNHKATKWRKAQFKLSTGRVNMGKGTVISKEGRLLMSGGQSWDKIYHYYAGMWYTWYGWVTRHSQEFVDLKGSGVVSELLLTDPVVLHCNIQVNNNQMLVTGGYRPSDGYHYERTFFMALSKGDEVYTDQPNMNLNLARYRHTCGKITLSSGKEVAMVAGGDGGDGLVPIGLRSVEILYLGSLGTGWKYAKSLPSKFMPGSRILTDFNREVTYFLGGGQAAELICPDADDATACHFEPLPGIQTQVSSYKNGVIMAVPESLAEEMCGHARKQD